LDSGRLSTKRELFTRRILALACTQFAVRI
jgi:hypothetical protein